MFRLLSSLRGAQESDWRLIDYKNSRASLSFLSSTRNNTKRFRPAQHTTPRLLMMAENLDFAARSSYQQYKLDTSAFLTWLLKTAQALGYQYVANDQSVAPIKSTGLEITVNGSRVPVREITRQAQLVCSASSDIGHLTGALLKIARRAIKMRQLFSAYVMNNLPQTDETLEADSKHEFFTNVLEEAVDILETQ